MNTNNETNRFSLTRFANVAHSNGSVLPFWLNLKQQGKPLKLTDPKMNRLIFTQEDAANLIKRTIEFTQKYGGGFVKSYRMKCVNMLDLAKFISDDVEIVGKRPGEKTDEDLISQNEIDRTYIYDDDIHIRMEENEQPSKISKIWRRLFTPKHQLEVNEDE